MISVRGIPDQNDPAALDYIEVAPATRNKALLTDLPCAEGTFIEDAHGNKQTMEDVVGPDLAGWAGATNIGNPVEGMLVQVFQGDGKTPVASTHTNEEGGFHFRGLPPGRYRLSATSNWSTPITGMVRLDPAVKAQECLVVD